MPNSIFPLAIATSVAVYNVAQVLCGDQCFNIDQIQEQGYFPCNPSAPTSNCCQSDWVCLSNGLCEPSNASNPDPLVYAGFCTDPLWDNVAACPKICQNNLTAGIDVSNRVSSCGYGYFCCYEDNNSTARCSTSSNGFFLGMATIVTTITGPSPTPATTSSGTSGTSAKASPLAYPCPNIDGHSYTDATGSSYEIQCSTDYGGNDLPAVHTDTFEECLRGCDQYVPDPFAASDASCIGVSWQATNPGRNCYLKYQITTINTDDSGISSGYYVNYTLPRSAVTSQDSSPSIENAPATSSTYSAMSTSIRTSTVSGASGSQVVVGVGTGVGIPVGLANTLPRSAVTSQDSSPSIENAPATSSTYSAIPTSIRTPTPSGGSDSHVAVGAGTGVGIPVGLAILAGFFYLMRRQSKTRPEEILEMHAVANDKNNDRLRELWAERRLDELPAEYKPEELIDPRGARAELSEIREHRAEIG